MKICRLKIDSKGRIQLPKSFLDANNISFDSWGVMDIIVGKHRSVKFTFESREESKSRLEYLKMGEETNG